MKIFLLSSQRKATVYSTLLYNKERMKRRVKEEYPKNKRIVYHDLKRKATTKTNLNKIRKYKSLPQINNIVSPV